ncbi:MAG: cyclophilin-like fold protein [Flavobacteriales bacterium]
MAQDRTAATITNDPSRARVNVVIGDRHFTATLIDGPAAKAFLERLPLSLDMSELNGNEKHGRLAHDLPTQVTAPGRIRAGDLMLWGANTLVLFYKDFATTYGYTRLGRIDDAQQLEEVLGKGAVVVKFGLN